MKRNQRCLFSDDRAVADILKRTRQQLTASGNGKVEGGATLDARVERLEHAMQAVVERLDGESNDRIASVEVDGRPTKSYQNYQGTLVCALAVGKSRSDVVTR